MLQFWQRWAFSGTSFPAILPARSHFLHPKPCPFMPKKNSQNVQSPEAVRSQVELAELYRRETHHNLRAAEEDFEAWKGVVHDLSPGWDALSGMVDTPVSTLRRSLKPGATVKPDLYRALNRALGIPHLTAPDQVLVTFTDRGDGVLVNHDLRLMMNSYGEVTSTIRTEPRTRPGKNCFDPAQLSRPPKGRGKHHPVPIRDSGFVGIMTSVRMGELIHHLHTPYDHIRQRVPNPDHVPGTPEPDYGDNPPPEHPFFPDMEHPEWPPYFRFPGSENTLPTSMYGVRLATADPDPYAPFVDGVYFTGDAPVAGRRWQVYIETGGDVGVYPIPH